MQFRKFEGTLNMLKLRHIRTKETEFGIYIWISVFSQLHGSKKRTNTPRVSDATIPMLENRQKTNGRLKENGVRLDECNDVN